MRRPFACEQNLNQNLLNSYFFASEQAAEYRKEQENRRDKDINQTTKSIIGCAIEVHRQLGPGLLESTYEACLYYELINAGLKVQRQLALPLLYKEIHLEQRYRLDLLVDDCVVVEIKMVESINNIHVAQVLTYLKRQEQKLD